MDKKGTQSNVNNYLQELFPECLIDMEWDFHSGGLKFRVDNPDGRIKHRSRFTSEFLEDQTTDEIVSKLNLWVLKKILDMAQEQMVFVTYNGIKIQSS